MDATLWLSHWRHSRVPAGGGGGHWPTVHLSPPDPPCPPSGQAGAHRASWLQGRPREPGKRSCVPPGVLALALGDAGRGRRVGAAREPGVPWRAPCLQPPPAPTTSPGLSQSRGHTMRGSLGGFWVRGRCSPDGLPAPSPGRGAQYGDRSPGQPRTPSCRDPTDTQGKPAAPGSKGTRAPR